MGVWGAGSCCCFFWCGGGEWQAGVTRVVVVVVDAGHVAARGGEVGRGDDGAVAGAAVHPHVAGGHVGEPARQVVQGDVHRPGDVGLFPFQLAADVEHDRVIVVVAGRDGGGEVAEPGERQGGQRLAAGPV